MASNKPTPCDLANDDLASKEADYNASKAKMDELLADDATLQGAKENLSSLSTSLSNNAGHINDALDKMSGYQFGTALVNVRSEMKQVANDTTSLSGAASSVQGDIGKAQTEIEKRVRELKPIMENQYTAMKNAEEYRDQVCS